MLHPVCVVSNLRGTTSQVRGNERTDERIRMCMGMKRANKVEADKTLKANMNECDMLQIKSKFIVNIIKYYRKCMYVNDIRRN